MGICQKIVADKVYFMKYLDSDAKSLVKHLLTADISKHHGRRSASRSGRALQPTRSCCPRRSGKESQSQLASFK